MPLYISKSQYCNAVQCPKMLWMKRHMPDEFDSSVMNEAVLVQGSEVGDLAMGLFGDFIEVPYGKPAEMVEATKALMDANTPIIAEASFSFEGQFCSVDILLNKGNGAVEIYEVKSSTHVNEIYLHDIAYQTYVLTKLGYTVRRVCVVHIDPDYVRHGALDLNQLFTIEDETETVMNLQPDVEQRLRFLDPYLACPNEPEQSIGPHCSAPYDCGFWSYCTRALPKPNIFDLSGIQKGTKFKHYDQGIISFADIETKGKVNDTAMYCPGGFATIEASSDYGNYITWTSYPTDTTLYGQEHNFTIHVAPSRATIYDADYDIQPYDCHSRKSIIVTLPEPIEARIYANPTEIPIDNLHVVFTDVSIGDITSQKWILPTRTETDRQVVHYYPTFEDDSVTATLIVFNRQKCSDTAMTVVPILKGDLWVPNVFTPKVDGDNTRFWVKGYNLHEYEIYIYNRAGLIVYHSDDITQPWDGTYQGQDCIEASYVYLIKYSFQYNPSRKLEKVGSILLLR